jgi:D-alanine-D-alanine ligase
VRPRRAFGPGLDVAVLVDDSATVGAAAPAGGERPLAGADDMATHVALALEAKGHRPRLLALPQGVSNLFAFMGALEADAIQNHVECYGDQASLESSVRGVMELTGIPVTGAPLEGLALCLEKPRARSVLIGEGVPVPPAIVVRRPDDPLEGAPIPCIVKPAAQDASEGIDATSVCFSLPEARARLERLFSQGLGPALLEGFVDGRELNVSMIESPDGTLRALPVAEIDYTGFPADLPKILTFAAKWHEDSAEYKGSVSRRAELAPELEQALVGFAKRAFRATGLRGYGRVDFRLDSEGAPFALDVNPNPDLSRGAGLCLAAERAGMTYEDLVEGIVREAIERKR